MKKLMQTSHVIHKDKDFKKYIEKKTFAKDHADGCGVLEVLGMHATSSASERQYYEVVVRTSQTLKSQPKECFSISEFANSFHFARDEKKTRF